jgi:ribonuclease T1
MSWFARSKLVLTGLTLATALLAGAIEAKAPPPVGLQSTISLAELPSPGVDVYRRIHQGGPFVSEKDGSVFGNRERLLPAQKRGFYREYTVPTPGLNHRGVRRIVCGGQAKTPEICFFTADHYASFRQIAP